MIFENIVPIEPLDKYIQSIVYYKNIVFEHDKDKFLPDATTNLVIDFEDSPKYIYDNETLAEKQACHQAWFSGMHTQYITITSGSNAEMTVISFKSGGAYPFIRQSLEPFNNKVIPAINVFGEDFIHFRDNLIHKETTKEKLDCIQDWLLKRLTPEEFSQGVINIFIDEIKNTFDSMHIRQLAQKSGYSQKQFIQLFKKYVGLTPKQLHRIVRFNEILNILHKHERSAHWIKIAIDCGYYDQAHFIKDFHAFSGINPQKYIEDQGEWAHYIPVK